MCFLSSQFLVNPLLRGRWHPAVRLVANTHLRGDRGWRYDVVRRFHAMSDQAQNIGPATPPGLPPSKQNISVLPLYIAATKEESKRNEAVIRRDELKVYSDGSRIDGQVGAAAVMYRNGVEIGRHHRHLGSQEEYTSFEGELLGLVLALELVMRAGDVEGVRVVTMGGDNQAALRAIQPHEKQRPVTGQRKRLLNEFHGLIGAVKNRHPQWALRLSWMAGHVGILGQERAENDAKSAAHGWFSLDQQLLPQYRWALPPWYP